MYRVLFAEDELLVRLGLQNSIKWKDYDMELAGEADNGLTALEMFMEIRPDVLITDIKMGGMDGYELIRKIREVDSDCAIIIISCLDDFETLRKMMGYCIIGYILKASMTMQEISDVLIRAKEYLDHVRRQPKKSGEHSAGAGEQRLREYLLREDVRADEIRWKADCGLTPGEIKAVLDFRLREKDIGRINDLGMKLVHSLLIQQIPSCCPVQMSNTDFCVLSGEDRGTLKEDIRKVAAAVDNFLGVGFDVTLRDCDHTKSIRDNYRMLLETRQNATKGGETDYLIENAIRYMRENYSSQLGLTEIAGFLCISPGYFSSLFKKQTGKNFIEYLNNIRLEKVLYELQYTKDKVAGIAERNGFRNAEYFNRLFKKKMGTSPARWRQQNYRGNGKDAG